LAEPLQLGLGMAGRQGCFARPVRESHVFSGFGKPTEMHC
jgi:hypothetical protein